MAHFAVSMLMCFNCSPQGKGVIEKPNVYSLRNDNVKTVFWRGQSVSLEPV